MNEPQIEFAVCGTMPGPEQVWDFDVNESNSKKKVKMRMYIALLRI
jgi:hypothetical protein